MRYLDSNPPVWSCLIVYKTPYCNSNVLTVKACAVAYAMCNNNVFRVKVLLCMDLLREVRFIYHHLTSIYMVIFQNNFSQSVLMRYESDAIVIWT